MSNTSKKTTLWEFFQSLGKTFMLPVALLAFSGILLGVGSSLSSNAVKESIPFLDFMPLQLLFMWMTKIGLVAFIYLPIMFAVAIPLGLAREEKGVAAFAGFVGYAALNLSINFYLTVAGVLGNAEQEAAYGVKSIIGVDSIDTGILGAVIVGIIVAKLHARFYTYKMPDALAFFGGARFVPIITTVVLGVVGLIVPLIWPYFAAGINGVGTAISHAGPFGPFLFGAGERLLLPFGLHHILVALIRFTEAGGTMDVCGNTVSGALNIFYSELSCSTTDSFSSSATAFLSQGKMPAFLGGLPGAALAMYHCSRPENRGKVKALLLSGVVACVIGGITEPLEFLFLFVAPALYLIHAVLTGLGFMVMGLLDVTIGNTDGNIIDFFIFGILQGTATKWYLVPVVAGIWFAVYYSVFRFAITRFNLKTPGREVESAEQIASAVSGQKTTGYKGDIILEALGGADNIEALDNCITRLRLSVKDMSLVNDAVLKANGALGVVKLDAHNLQVVIGPQVHLVKNEIQGLMPA
ncbi:maltose/glucose-specific PTS transporter subunit IIBC [Photobacterium sp. ZSDE20]|uniref:Maltose/glucose-specific PTS transporter subunit IIBC n=1 Tax=Photobacterium pectinilyticum TaxID=2906793 RepID=A0ABT1N6V9_9GAMM|nr:maltose/glucose-specific PTS transporter subunit IIBC [Photobacterium sp. ZSDE20]MCQ1060486.1 maltose/glucose-specific PTS transporter subunit IIBC [Photobacterium sp. ZSDE20]MDD1827886.1 maltose/glucose-specific PTS transporter subunit IIBC [Photobacterium sp. ZSDE20]